MSCKVGIPQALLYYEYYPLWKEFFTELGAEIVLSSSTNKSILNAGVSSCVDEACLPVKVFHGHVEELKNKVDYLFIPKFISVCKKEYLCPKLLGLPEMVKNSIDNLPTIIDVEINLLKSNSNLRKSVIEIGKYFTSNNKKIDLAFNKAINRFNEYRKLLANGVIPIEAIKVYNKYINSITTLKNSKYKILVLGHSYNLYDEFLSMKLIEKLQKENMRVITPDTVSIDKINYYASKLPKRMFWSFGRKIVGASFYLIEENAVDGIIYISSFGCGLDSVLIDLVYRKAKKFKVPFTLVTLDEHSGEAGVNTRLEAFIDMIIWRDNNENHISTHG
ncbi:acyl-CoA dehydratase activase-related protein [Caloranaerobacter ferrireducens]|uniref:acyl-CoA dehydratase activase-related protein n=1 Tax=Caloranaerobacter ferrireducens TaxID=1323370 RepID=UPI00084E020A|nr:acyl-CoA dehydratase activase-related protein [Caloranaerobacter ferrireducens]